VPLRKPTIQAQLAEGLRTVLDPGERVVGSFYTLGGSAPVLQTSFGLVGAFFLKNYWVVLTDRRFIVLRARSFGSRLGEITFAQDRADVVLATLRRRPFFSSFVVHDPYTRQSLRLNVHRVWRAEFDQMMAAVGVTPGG
jgi:hypothetical protein